jgi:hypothetical protein
MASEPLNYYAFRDQNMANDLPNQPALSPDEIIRRISMTPGATFRPGEFEALMQLAKNAQAQQAQRDQINQYYDSPDRGADIERAVAPLEQQGFANLVNQLRGQSRQGAFARARTGNIGGSVQASQQAQLAGQGAAQGAQLANSFADQRNSLQQALQAARVSELLKSYNLDPALQASLQQRVNTYGVQGDTNTALEALRQQREQMTNFQNDEFSRALGNTVNLGTNMYTMNQNQGMMSDYQNYLNSLRRGQQQPAAQPAQPAQPSAAVSY